MTSRSVFTTSDANVLPTSVPRTPGASASSGGGCDRSTGLPSRCPAAASRALSRSWKRASTSATSSLASSSAHPPVILPHTS